MNERLQEIKAVFGQWCEGKGGELDRQDIEWLIEQVELIQSHAPEGRNYTNLQYVELRNKNTKLNHEIGAYSGKVGLFAKKLLDLEKEMLNL